MNLKEARPTFVGRVHLTPPRTATVTVKRHIGRHHLTIRPMYRDEALQC